MDGNFDTPSADGIALSVILPNFNHAPFVAQALTALLAQERLPDEIIVIDDGSTDDSLAIIGRFVAQCPAIRLIASPTNHGVVAALLRGIEESRGRYIYFGASDDWVAPGFFAAAIAALDANPQAGLFCGEALLVDGATGMRCGIRPIVRPTRNGRYLSPEATHALLTWTDNWLLTGSTVFRRDAVIAAGGLDERLTSFADGFLARRIALTHGFFYWPRIVAVWRVFSDSVSRVTAAEVEKAQDILRLVPQRILADPAFPDWYADVFSNRWRFAVSRLALLADPVNRPVLDALGGRSEQDIKTFDIALRALPLPLARTAILAWLWLRWHPNSLTGVTTTALCRRIERLFHRNDPAAKLSVLPSSH